MTINLNDSPDSTPSASSSRSSSPKAKLGIFKGRHISANYPNTDSELRPSPRAQSFDDITILTEKGATTQRTSLYKRFSNIATSLISPRKSTSSSSASDINPSFELPYLSLKDKFRHNNKPKLLLVPEGHNSQEANETRSFILGKNEIYSFSEGEDGQKALGGLRGIETQANFEIAPVLKEYLSQKDLSPHDLPPSAISTEEDVYDALKDFGVSKDIIKLIKKKFFKAKTPEEQEQAVTYFQNHFRDHQLAEAIMKECKNLLENSDKSIAVGFFGATHLIRGHDNQADKRTTEERIPELLIKMGEQGDECIRINGIDVYIYPYVLAGEELSEEFLSYFK